MKGKDFKQYQEYARKKLRGDILPEEEIALKNWLDMNEAEPLEIPPYIAPSRKVHQNRLYKKIKHGIAASKRSKIVRRMSVAATIVVLLGIVFLYRENRKNVSVSITGGQQQDGTSRFSPGSNKAMLILSGGRHLLLSGYRNGNIAKEGDVKIDKTADGKIVYRSAAGNKAAVPQMNILRTPVGGEFQVVLPDGSKVWINSASTLEYPTAFGRNDRVVTMTGEAYFEVEHDPGRPFHVRVKGLDIQVVGTHFNVDSYMDDGSIHTTLIEGAISAKEGSQLLHIKPGEQVNMTPDGRLTLKKDMDVNKIIAWKDGEFDFGENSDIHTVMNQLARWYGFDVEYQNKNLSARVAGGISRNVDGYAVLKMLEKTGSVRFKIQGEKVIVMSP